ncbi:hypothetical protein [Rahnella inusitata]|uniref:hypothetical protein n=1 Tax=Rahnella inusitata TaxID=58169 RepID=UPI0039BE29D4
MKLKIRAIKWVSLSPLAPRWLKVLCLQLVMNEIAKGFKSLFDKADLSSITQEQRDEINKAITKMNLARGKGMEA